VDRRLQKIRRAYERPERYERGMTLLERMIATARTRVGEIVGGRVLEIGIGSGQSLPHYRPDVELIGGDLSRPMLVLAGRRARDSARVVELVELDGRRLPFAGGSFDAVVFSLCLCTIPDPEVALTEALRVARPGAPIVLLEHVRSHVAPVAWLQDAVSLLSGPLSEEYFNRRTLDTARAAGVEVLRVRRWGLGFFNLIEGRRPDRRLA
jgi:ubiquinone/menaquinone biosynthesis C-methylase UbiE